MTSTMWRAIATAALCLTLAASCRTARPAGAPIAPLTASSTAEALEQLRERSAAFAGARSLMRVRATTNGKTQSFRAQLAVEDASTMQLIAYTPVGTTALVLRAIGKEISIDNHIDGTEWQGTADELARSLGFLGGDLLPAETAMLLLGFTPASGHVELTASAAGLERARAGDVTIEFEPAAFPAKRVVLTRGADRIEIDHLEIVAGGAE